MARQSYAESIVPAAGKDAIPYRDQRELANGSLRHAMDGYCGQVLGAGGAGGSLAGIPFEPMEIIVSEATGPTLVLQVRASSGDVNINMITGAANASLPVVSQAVDGSWTIALPTALAPDGDTATVLVHGYRDIAGSL